MSVAFTPLPAGTMTRATVLANFVLLRSWLNGGIVAADVTANTIRSQHIFRPDSYGFPLLAQHRATAAETAGRSKTRDNLLTYKAIHRLDLYVSGVNNDNAVRMTPDLGITFDHWGPTSYVVVQASWTAVAVTEYPALYTIFYQGYFQIKYRERATGTSTAVTNSRRQLQSPASTSGNPMGPYSTQARFQVTAGTWDVWVEWVPDVAQNADTEACIIGLNSITMRTYQS